MKTEQIISGPDLSHVTNREQGIDADETENENSNSNHAVMLNNLALAAAFGYTRTVLAGAGVSLRQILMLLVPITSSKVSR